MFRGSPHPLVSCRWWRSALVLTVLAFGVQHAPEAVARPEAPSVFCSKYPSIPACQGRVPACTTCHISVQPVSWNAFGRSLFPHLQGPSFESALSVALEQIENEDADSDGATNLEELRVGSNPADPESLLIPPDPVEGTNPNYDIGRYDPVFAFRRVHALYCGKSPSYEALQKIRNLDSVDERRARVHDALDACVASDYWRKVALFRIADRFVRPIKIFGPDTDFEPAPGIKAILGDYHYDYRLFSYAMTGDRDARELVTAQYHVEEADDGTWTKVEGVIAPPFAANRGGQPLEPQHRAGMLTAQWTIVTNAMLTAVPRVLTGHIYRTYLGMDISVMEGLSSIEGEPLDIDARGVGEPQCAVCHATLDPATYALTSLVGLDGISAGLLFGTYDPNRLTRMLPEWPNERPQPFLRGQPVESAVEVGGVIANDPAFHRTLAETFFEHALGRSPGPGDFEQFSDVWMQLPADGYSINRMLHRLIDTDAFAAP